MVSWRFSDSEIDLLTVEVFLCEGLNTSLVPMYISEIAPLNLRGGLGTVNQLAVTIGLLLSQVLGIEQILGTNDGWPVLLGLAICPAILQLILLPICPESPRYLLITKQWEEEARKGKNKIKTKIKIRCRQKLPRKLIKHQILFT